LGYLIDELENDSRGLSALTNRQLAVVFALQIVGVCLIGGRSIELNFRQTNIEQVSRLERTLALWIFSTFIGLTICLLYLFAVVFKLYGLIDSANGSETHDPIIAVYFSVITWTTVGYGDFLPTE
jgi:hypothetical protein